MLLRAMADHRGHRARADREVGKIRFDFVSAQRPIQQRAHLRIRRYVFDAEEPLQIRLPQTFSIRPNNTCPAAIYSCVWPPQKADNWCQTKRSSNNSKKECSGACLKKERASNANSPSPPHNRAIFHFADGGHSSAGRSAHRHCRDVVRHHRAARITANANRGDAAGNARNENAADCHSRHERSIDEV